MNSLTEFENKLKEYEKLSEKFDVSALVIKLAKEILEFIRENKNE